MLPVSMIQYKILIYLFRREVKQREAKIAERNRFLRSEVHINQNGRACMQRHQLPHSCGFRPRQWPTRNYSFPHTGHSLELHQRRRVETTIIMLKCGLGFPTATSPPWLIYRMSAVA